MRTHKPSCAVHQTASRFSANPTLQVFMPLAFDMRMSTQIIVFLIHFLD